MECPICYDAITAETGVVTTSCGHSYHFACLSGWFMQQANGTCPCCRKGMTTTEDFPQSGEETEEESDDENYVYDGDESEQDEDDDEEEMEVEFKREDLDSFLRARGGRGLTEEMAQSICAEAGDFMRLELHFLCVGNGAGPITDEDWEALTKPRANFRISLTLEEDVWTRTVEQI